MTKVLAYCGECGRRFDFGLEVDPSSTTVGDLKEAIREKLGGSEYVCPRCESIVHVAVGQLEMVEPDRLARAAAADQMTEDEHAIRFGVGSPDGPRSSVWRVWTNDRRDDVYIAARGIASELKVSLHPNYWYFGFTSHHAARETSLVPPGADRQTSVWERPAEFAPGWTRAFAIVVPASEVAVAPSPYTGSNAIWRPTPPEGQATYFTVLLSKPDAQRGRRGFPAEEGYEDSTELVTRLDLSTGERVWIAAHDAPVTEAQVEQLKAAGDHVARIGEEALRTEAKRRPSFDPRALLFGHDEAGARLFMDVSLAKYLPSSADDS